MNSDKMTNQSPGFKVPYAILVPMWSILVAIFLAWHSYDKSMTLLAKDVSTLSRAFIRMEKRVDLEAITSYNKSDATRAFNILSKDIMDLRRRIILIENKRK